MTFAYSRPPIQEVALNLCLGDEIEIDSKWWKVIEHSVTFRERDPVRLSLVSIDGYDYQSFFVEYMKSFNCLRVCGH